MNRTTTTKFFKKQKTGAGASFFTLFRRRFADANFFAFFALFLAVFSGILVFINFLHFLRILLVLGFPL